MNPWCWIWFSPHLQWPLSGNVTQDIEPVAQLFQGQSGRGRGKPHLEQQAFHVASYGQQLGLITEVLLALASERPPHDAHARHALQRLQAIAGRIGLLKGAEPEADMAELARSIALLVAADDPAGRLLAKALREALPAPPQP